MGNAFHPEVRGEGGDAGMIDLNTITYPAWQKLHRMADAVARFPGEATIFPESNGVEITLWFGVDPLKSEDLRVPRQQLIEEYLQARLIPAETSWDDDKGMIYISVADWTPEAVATVLDRMDPAFIIEFNRGLR